MAFLRKGNGDGWYVSRTPHGSSNTCGRREAKVFRNWWLIKNHNNRGTSGELSIHKITTPKELIGKKVRLRLEIMEDKK